jgi:hypothetical protein
MPNVTASPSGFMIDVMASHFGSHVYWVVASAPVVASDDSDWRRPRIGSYTASVTYPFGAVVRVTSNG